MAKCFHKMRFSIRGEAFLDSNIVMMSMRFTCDLCGEPFRALGVGDGVSAEEPGLADDGEMMVFPLVPIGEEPQTVRAGRC